MLAKLKPLKVSSTERLDKRGRVITPEQWRELIEDMDYSRVKQQWTPGTSYYVSTVWIGLPGDIFETIVFGNRTTLEEHRYQTLDEAKAGHKRVYTKYANLDKVVIDGEEEVKATRT